jgi:hypothetical protein
MPKYLEIFLLFKYGRGLPLIEVIAVSEQLCSTSWFGLTEHFFLLIIFIMAAF